MRPSFVLTLFCLLIIQVEDSSESPEVLVDTPSPDPTGQVQNRIGDANLEKSLQSISPMQVDLLYRACDSDLAERAVGTREWPAAFRICASENLSRISSMTPLIRTIVSRQCHTRLISPKFSVRNCILNGAQTADLHFESGSEVADGERRDPGGNSFDSVEEMQRKLAKQVDVFTYNGDNRRPPQFAAERRAIRATGIVRCSGSGSGFHYGSGFVISTGGGYSIVLTAGHVIRDSTDDRMRVGCQYLPYGRNTARVDAKRAPLRAHLEEYSDERVRKDWGMLRVEGELLWTMPLTQRGKDEIVRLLVSRNAYLKLYSRHPDPPQSRGPQIQVSDDCELLNPVGRRDLFESPHVLYHTCDSVSGGSGGLLAMELPDGTTEAIGLNRSTANTARYKPRPNGRNDAVPRSDRVSGIALSLAADGSMPAELRRSLP